MNNQPIPGKNAAIASMVCGIISIVFWFFGVTAFLSLVLGIVGLVLASNAKKAGYNDGLIFVSCVACAGIIGTASGLSALSAY